MPYIGRQQDTGAYIKLDDISDQFDGVKNIFNLTLGTKPFYVHNPYSLLVSIDGVIQEPVTSYIITENQITFAGALAPGTDFFAVVLSTTTNAAPMTSLTIGRRDTTAHTMDMPGEALGILSRATGNKIPVHFNAT